MAEPVLQAKPSTVAPPTRRAVNAPRPLSNELTPPLDKALLDDPKTPEHKLLADKIAERDRIQQEIDALCEQLQTGEQIWVELEMLEVNLTKMREQGLDYTFDGKSVRSSRQDADLPGLLNELRKNNLAKQLFAPRVTSVSGRPATVFVGMQSPILAGGSIQAVEYVEYGQRLEVLPTALGNDKVRIDFRASVNAAGGEREIEDKQIPRIESTECGSTVEMTYGETLLLSGLLSQRVVAKHRRGLVVEEVNDIQMLVVLTADSLPAKVAQLPREVGYSIGN
jgi:Bacterial type II and III secretion system protein